MGESSLGKNGPDSQRTGHPTGLHRGRWAGGTGQLGGLTTGQDGAGPWAAAAQPGSSFAPGVLQGGEHNREAPRGGFEQGRGARPTPESRGYEGGEGFPETEFTRGSAAGDPSSVFVTASTKLCREQFSLWADPTALLLVLFHR